MVGTAAVTPRRDVPLPADSLLLVSGDERVKQPHWRGTWFFLHDKKGLTLRKHTAYPHSLRKDLATVATKRKMWQE